MTNEVDGTISSNGTAIFLSSNFANDVEIVNRGTIAASSEDVTIGGNGVFAFNGQVELLNEGVIDTRSTDMGALGVAFNTSSVSSPENEDIITNGGTIFGDIFTGEGDDVYTARAGAEQEGRLDLGAGDCLLYTSPSPRD